jgi:hypothetical protein
METHKQIRRLANAVQYGARKHPPAWLMPDSAPNARRAPLPEVPFDDWLPALPSQDHRQKDFVLN